MITLVMAILGLLGLAGYLGIFGALHVLPTGYQPVRHAVSDYGVGRYSPLFRRGLLLSSLGVLFLAIGLLLSTNLWLITAGVCLAVRAG